jgi:methylenetetrahydrofolate dehydrogenase (NADP+)/methenyltetrahydrofolate cyclohydrolase
VRALVELLEAGSYDGVFIEFPFPAGISAAELTALIPASRDIDIMTEGRTRRYLAGLDPHPPLTISAALELLAAYGVEIAGLPGVVVAEPTPFALIFREAFARRGAEMREIISPDAPDLEALTRGAKVVVATAARPGLLRTGWLERGAVVIDAGYFNPHGHGDIDTSDGIGHLSAFAPVPGGVGPMTVSTMIERLLDWAERSEAEP